MLKDVLMKVFLMEEEFHKKVIACDLDGTLAYYTTYKGQGVIGKPITMMVDRVKKWINDGEEVVIFTARAHDPKEVEIIKKWCKDNVGKELEVTNIKKPEFSVFYDDRAEKIERNTGKILSK